MKKNKALKTIKFQKAEIDLQTKGVTIYALLEKRKTLKDNSHPIKIRVTQNRKYRDYSTRQKAKENEWLIITAPKPKGIAADKKIQIITILERAYNIINEMEAFSFNEFKELFLNKSQNDKNNIYNWYEDKITELKKNDQFGTAQTYTYSMKALKDFSNKSVLTFDDVTVKFLNKFEKHINNNSTAGIYLRPLRAVFNMANKVGNEYPFSKTKNDGKYKIPNPRNNKRALSIEEVKSIYFYEPKQGSKDKYYKDIWLFSYFANGINVKDICLLKKSDIKNDYIEIRRAKTEKTNKDIKPIIIELTDDLKRIIDEHGTAINNDDFIFPVYNMKMSIEKQELVRKTFVSQINKGMKRITTALKIDKKVTTQHARHSFATILKNSDVSPIFIGESLGHSSLKTTELYLGSFPTDQRKKNIKKLKDW